MSKYHVLPLTVYGPEGRSKPRISWRVVDTEQSDDGRWKVATCPDEGIARKVCAFLNGEGGHWLDPDLAQRHADALELAALRAERDKLADEAKRWQSTLDHTNKLLGVARSGRDTVAAECSKLRAERDVAVEQMRYARALATVALLADNLRNDVRDILRKIKNGEI